MLRILNRAKTVLVGSFLTAAVVIGGFTLYTEANAAPKCICPLVYAPVVCSNGKTYPNLCVAKCHNATGCVPVIIVPPPV